MLPAPAASRIGLLLADSEQAPTVRHPRLGASLALFLAGFLVVALHAGPPSGSFDTPRTRLVGGVATTQRHDGHEDPRMEITQKLGAAASAAALSFGATALAQDAVQWRVEDGGNGHWYRTVRTADRVNHAQASAIATGQGGHLFTGCGAEFDAAVALTSALSTDYWVADSDSQWLGPWIGLQFANGAWSWPVDAQCTFDRWDISLSQPDSTHGFGESLAFMYTVGSGPRAVVHDVPTHFTTSSLLIEWSADCNSDSIVDFGQIRAGQLPDANANGIPDGCETDNGGPYAAVQWHPKSGGNGHWYQVVVASQGLGWSAARNLAAGLGGELACADADGEKNFYFTSFGPAEVPSAWTRQAPWTEPNFGPWIGGMQDPGAAEPLGGWRWISGTSFNPAELGCCDDSGCAGSEDRLHLLLAEGAVTWNDLPDTWSCGSMPSSLLVEWSADCNNDGVVDFGQIRAGELEDTNHNNIPDCCEGTGSCNCPGDVARDGVVNGIDLAAVLNNWGTTGGVINADANHDGTVDATDLAIVLSGWGACP